MAKTGVKKDNKTLDIKTVCECCHCLGSKTLHPQVSLINLEKPELEEDAVMMDAMDCGADDYISKPFGIMEFLSRVRASLRRAAPEERPNVLSFHEILLDNARHSVTAKSSV